ncbi:MAG TPA: hypothetical protein DIW17_18695 [Clostridiales bacterium]|nr:hypothetical protein [Clostridia bacterium]HCS75887.1 hypothetical protein [Clostridiales bacterium]
MEFNTQDMKNMSQIAGRMQGKSEDQIISELAEMIRTGQSGLTIEKAEQMFQTIMPMLTQEQKAKINKLLAELR